MLKITFGETEISEYLRVDADQDVTIIETIKNAAIGEAERFLNTDFSTSVTNQDGTTTITENEVPAEVKEWVLNRIVEKYENRGNPIKPNYGPLKPHRIMQFRGFA